MVTLNILTDILDSFNEFIEPIVSFFKDLWTSISNFLLQYMPQDALNILAVGILVTIILIIGLAVINNRD